MTDQRPIEIPPPAKSVFAHGIHHPDLWLWDAWNAVRDSTHHLFCLAINRQAADGTPTTPAMRNQFPFHVRHFTSRDDGISWQDEGAVLQPLPHGDGGFARNVWSGSVLSTQTGFLVGFTGIREMGPNRPFLQTIYVVEADAAGRIRTLPHAPVSCPLRDHDPIIRAGYYLDTPDRLGHRDGEDGGPILAWRDPYLVQHKDGLHAFWSAKISPTEGAVAHARLRRTEHGTFEIDTLFPPATLSDGHEYTQAEVPKIYPDPRTGGFLLLISACDRLNETQADSEVTKSLRLYTGETLSGPWRRVDGALHLPSVPTAFGATLLSIDGMTDSARVMAPQTEYAAPADQLTFAPVQTVRLRSRLQTRIDSRKQQS